tara:strand:+ start:536 stop:745 length:210 start_codon:yes stop_codon:yes gene_type:complete
MENKDKDKNDSLWAKFVDSFEEYKSTSPFFEMDEAYMTSQQRANMYAEAAAELKAKLKLMKEQKKKNEK